MDTVRFSSVNEAIYKVHFNYYMSVSIKVEGLTKIYGDRYAIKDVSFSTTSNSITGFLGPNGAGKSTTMKILTGFLPPTSGNATVNGIDVTTDPLAIKKQIGYLPENNPLYLDMYVHEFLRFSGSLYKMNSRLLGERIKEMISRCGLEEEQNKKLGELSKGYRQRVGIAQSLLHDPEILILDEPTTGLDPNQIQEVRNLIKEVSKSKTVILSTHIMQEVQAICENIILINQGKIVVDEDLKSLMMKGRNVSRIILETEKAINTKSIIEIEGVIFLAESSDNKYLLDVEVNDTIKSQIADWVIKNGYGLAGLKEEEVSMEQIFKSLTSSDD